MASWRDFEREASDLAKDIQRRFDSSGLGLLATLRRDGSPRITAIETFFGAGELWLGMMGGSLKARDLQHDPRCALHAATIDKDVKDGDAKVAGVAVEVTDEAGIRAFVEATREAIGMDPPEPFHAFTLDVREASTMRPAGDHLELEIWREGRGVEHVDRR
jgi:hypothetical protein